MSELIVGWSDLSKICRLCLAADLTVLIDIFSFCNEINSRISEAIMKCASVQIDVKDKLPSVICNRCYQKLIDIGKFQNEIISSEETLVTYLEKLENHDNSNIDSSKSHLAVKKEPLDITVKCEDNSCYLSEQSKYNDIGDSTIHSYDSTNFEKVKVPVFINSNEFGAKKECQMSENSGFCTVDVQGDTNANNSIIEDSDKDDIDISESKICLQNICDEDLKKMDLRHNVSVADELNEFCLSDSKINENVQTPDQYDSHKNSFSKKPTVKNNSSVKSQYQCNVCDKSFSKSSDLNRHKHMHTGEKPYKCDFCDKNFSRLDHLIRHKRAHTGERPYKCDLCNKSFSWSNNLVEHKRTHNGEKPYRCDFCDKSFAQAGNLISHKRTHTGEKPYICNICNKTFFHSATFSCHKRTHTGEKPYKCDFCDKSFAHACYLIGHKRTHTGEKPYKCDCCDKSFAQVSNLNTHKRSHTGEKPFKCDLCDKSFSTLCGLIRHKRTHTGEKPYKCDLCDKSFSQTGILYNHKRTHTGEKPYKCDRCVISFSTLSSLIRHKRTHSDDNSVQSLLMQ